jgi:hypothetical protein
MKKIITFTIVTIVSIYIANQIYNYYNSTHILSSQAAFKVYLDIKESDIDAFFGLKKGTFNKQKDLIICQLPVNDPGFKGKCVIVNSNIGNIDCGRIYNNKTDIKYANSELDGNNFKLLIIKAGGFPIGLFDADLPIMSNMIISYKDLTAEYNRGKINNIVISADSVYNYCAK